MAHLPVSLFDFFPFTSFKIVSTSNLHQEGEHNSKNA